jgi:hypothetical protein
MDDNRGFASIRHAASNSRRACNLNVVKERAERLVRRHIKPGSVHPHIAECRRIQSTGFAVRGNPPLKIPIGRADWWLDQAPTSGLLTMLNTSHRLSPQIHLQICRERFAPAMTKN